MAAAAACAVRSSHGVLNSFLVEALWDRPSLLHLAVSWCSAPLGRQPPPPPPHNVLAVVAQQLQGC